MVTTDNGVIFIPTKEEFKEWLDELITTHRDFNEVYKTINQSMCIALDGDGVKVLCDEFQIAADIDAAIAESAEVDDEGTPVEPSTIQNIADTVWQMMRENEVPHLKSTIIRQR